MHELYLEQGVERFLKKLSVLEFNRIISHVKRLIENPRPQGCRKISGSKNDWRIRIGDFRVIYEIDDKAKVVRIMRIKHRRDAYR